MGHDIVEIIRGDESIVIEIGLREHFLQLFIGHVLPEILSNPFQLENGYLTGFMGVEGGKDFVYLCATVLVAEFGGG